MNVSDLAAQQEAQEARTLPGGGNATDIIDMPYNDATVLVGRAIPASGPFIPPAPVDHVLATENTALRRKLDTAVAALKDYQTVEGADGIAAGVLAKIGAIDA